MAQLGADVEELDRLARKFDEEAQQISQATQQISSQVQSTWWKGHDSDRFKSEWNSNYASQLRKIAEALKQVGSTVRKQAAQQRQTSGA
jgi:uncharacterized protein YukE